MKSGDTVRVFPHGSPLTATEAEVVLLSSNARSIALRLKDMPPWVHVRGEAVFLDRRDLSIVMLLTRESFGPWIEVTNGGHYEIEDLPSRKRRT